MTAFVRLPGLVIWFCWGRAKSIMTNHGPIQALGSSSAAGPKFLGKMLNAMTLCGTSGHNRYGLPFRLAAPSMVFGPDLMENVHRLATIVDHVEVVLFWTPDLHNIPSKRQSMRLAYLVGKHDLGCSVHLPTSLEIASEHRRQREASVAMIANIVRRMGPINPQHYILHVPFTKPTLTAIPGVYFSEAESDRFDAWTERARKSLQALCSTIGPGSRMLVENINYSPSFLVPFYREGLCGLCIDIGHLMLGGESVRVVLEKFLPMAEEIHLHGVHGSEEHLSLSLVEPERLAVWATKLQRYGFDGVVNLEVFCESDLEASIIALTKVFAALNCF